MIIQSNCIFSALPSPFTSSLPTVVVQLWLPCRKPQPKFVTSLAYEYLFVAADADQENGDNQKQESRAIGAENEVEEGP